jgi:uncharacterized protein with PIN domain
MPEPETLPAPPRFATDRNLIRLARWLRLMGADVTCDSSWSASDALTHARASGRILLTRDKRISRAQDTLYIERHLFRDQLREVLVRFPFDPRPGAFTRCAQCNNPLHHVRRDALCSRVPPFVYASQEHFAVCAACGKVYWPATHRTRILAEIIALLAAEPAHRGMP